MSAGDALDGVLGPLERQVMEIVWRRTASGGPVTAGEVLAALPDDRSPAHTTINTILERLVAKGLLSREKGGKLVHYRPMRSRAETVRSVSADLLRGLFGLSRSTAIATFVDLLSTAEPDALDELQRRIERKKAERQDDDTEAETRR